MKPILDICFASQNSSQSQGSNSQSSKISNDFPFVIESTLNPIIISSFPALIMRYLIYYFNLKSLFNKSELLRLSGVSQNLYNNKNSNSKENTLNKSDESVLIDFAMYSSNYYKYLDDLVLGLNNLKEKLKTNESKSSSGNSTDDELKKIVQTIETNFFYINYKRVHEATQSAYGLYRKYHQIMTKKSEGEKTKDKEKDK